MFQLDPSFRYSEITSLIEFKLVFYYTSFFKCVKLIHSLEGSRFKNNTFERLASYQYVGIISGANLELSVIVWKLFDYTKFWRYINSSKVWEITKWPMQTQHYRIWTYYATHYLEESRLKRWCYQTFVNDTYFSVISKW